MSLFLNMKKEKKKLLFDRLREWANAIIEVVLQSINRKGPNSDMEEYYRTEWYMVNGMMRMLDFKKWWREWLNAVTDPDSVVPPDGNYGLDFLNKTDNEGDVQ